MKLVEAQKQAKELSKNTKARAIVMVNLADISDCVASTVITAGVGEKVEDGEKTYQVTQAYNDGKLVEKHSGSTDAEAETEAPIEKTKKPMAKKPAKKAPAKKVAAKKTAPKKAAPVKKEKGEQRFTRGNNMALTAAQWKKVDAILEKKGVSFSSFSRSLVEGEIK